MLHIVTPLYRYENLPDIYGSIPKHEDITWHIAKTSRREKLINPFLKTDKRIVVYEIDCEDSDIITKRNTVFDNIRDGQFHLLDDDTIFYPKMYDIYKQFENFDGMVIGRQLRKNMSRRLNAIYPAECAIDAGNVLCHSSILRKVKWENRKGIKNSRDFIFWDNCFKIFGKEKTVTIPADLSIYNFLNPTK